MIRLLFHPQTGCNPDGMATRCGRIPWGVGLLLLAAGTASAAGASAPPRPVCEEVGTGKGACRWNPDNALGPGATVVLSDTSAAHGQSKAYLRAALQRLSLRYGFTLTRIRHLNDITEANLADAKVIVFSSGDGDLGGSIPSAAVRARVEKFVMQRGWGILAVHAACSFIDTWPFLQDVCVQGYFHHNPSGTRAKVHVVDTTVDGVGHGRRNPYTSFLLAGLPDSESMTNEWFTWRGNPRTAHQYNRESKNKVMLLALDEATFSATEPRYPGENYAVWTHTMGPADGVTIFHSPGHDDVYIQGTQAYGDTLLWRMLRYAAKDWCRVGSEGCPEPPVSARTRGSGSVRKVFRGGGRIAVSLPGSGRYRITVTDVAGKPRHREEKSGPGNLIVVGLPTGLYFVRTERDGRGSLESLLVP